MASEHLMKASLAHLPDGGCSHSLPGGGVAHCAHNSLQPFAATDLLPSAAGHLSPDHLLPNLPEETDQKIAAWIQSDQVGSKHLISDQEQKFYLMTDQNEH